MFEARAVSLTYYELCSLIQLPVLKHKNIMFCKPDKGNGVVVMDESDYHEKLLAILNHRTKFKVLQDDPTVK